MGGVVQLSNPEWDANAQRNLEQHTQNQRIEEDERTKRQAKLSAIVGDSLNALPLPKDDKGNPDINNPAYNDIMQRRQKLIGSLLDEYTPVQHANIVQRIGGLITGNKQHAMPHHNQPLPAMGTGPAALAAQQGGEQAAEAAQALQQNQTPQQPMETVPVQSNPFTPLPNGHPANKIMEGIKSLGAGLKNHAQAFAHPDLKKPDQSELINNLASSYADPQQLQHERNMELWGLKGENALDVARERTKALIAGKPPRFVSQVTVPDLMRQMEVDPEMEVVGTNGEPIPAARLSEMPPGTIARQFMKGPNVIWALGDQNSKTANIGGRIFDIPAVGPITAQNSTDLGQATSTLPKASSTTDPFGLTQTTNRSTPATPGMIGATQNPVPAAPVAPTLKTRPVSSAAPPAPNSLAAVNAGIAAANAASPKLNKGKPVSAAAPAMPAGQVPLDENGHIPAGVGNDLVRQFANNILDGRDPKEIPNPKAQAAALAMVDKAVPGYSRGAFTPKEKIQFETAITFLNQLKDSPSLKVLDSYWSREKLAKVMQNTGDKSTFMSRLAATAETGPEQELVRNIQQAAGVVQGLSGITRSGRATNAGVTTLKTELPNVFQTTSSEDAKKRIENLLKEADIALHTNPRDVGKSGPKSSNAPGAAPKVGDTKTFPNGKTGTWDGTGWAAQ